MRLYVQITMPFTAYFDFNETMLNATHNSSSGVHVMSGFGFVHARVPFIVIVSCLFMHVLLLTFNQDS